MKTITVKSPRIITYEQRPNYKPEIIKKKPLVKRYKHRISPNSMLAYLDVLENLGERQEQVYKAIRDLKSVNNKMIAAHLNLEINTVVPRVFELREFGIVKEDKKDLCPYTKKLTSYWKVVREL